MRATKKTAAAVVTTVAAFAGSALLMGAPASALQGPAAQDVVAAQGEQKAAANALASALEDYEREPGSNTLRPGQILEPGEIVLSGNHKYAVGQLEDGNFVYGNVEDQDNPKILFATNTHGNPGAAAGMQPDGNLVVFDQETEERLWASNTDGHPDSWLQVKDDGELAIFGQDGKHKWTQNNQIAKIGPDYRMTEWRFLSSRNREYHLVMQAAGNLVLYDKDQNPLWATPTEGNPGAYAMLQTDGNLIVFSKDDEPLWSTKTAGQGATKLTLDNNGVLAVMNEDGKSVWAVNN